MALDTVFNNISSQEIKHYTKYWKSIQPKTDEEIFKRWLFAYTSIHTTWQGNLRGYNAIKNFDEWIGSKQILSEKLFESKCGMHNKRTEFIWNFAQDFFANTKDFHKQKNESWIDFRNRLVKKCNGIGIAKVSFTLEMCFPTQAEVVCLDVHMLRLYEIPILKFGSKKDIEIYQNHEQDWIHRSKALRTSPYISRCIFWDKKQKQSDSRYWSWVLEG